MGAVKNLVVPISVAYEGKALTVVAKLTRAVVILTKLTQTSQTCIGAELEETIRILNEVIALMSAIDNAYGRILTGADEIIEYLDDGETTGFLNKATEIHSVVGLLARRNRTLSIYVIGVNTDDDQNILGVQDKNESNNVVLFDPKYLSKKNNNRKRSKMIA